MANTYSNRELPDIHLFMEKLMGHPYRQDKCMLIVTRREDTQIANSSTEFINVCQKLVVSSHMLIYVDILDQSDLSM